MNFLDLFAGIGGFRMGLEQSGHTCIGHVEIDKFANQSYQAIHKPKEWEFYHDDITTITDDTWRTFRGRCEILTAGFPCQAFSVAGKQRGFEDNRGTMFFPLANATKQIKPRYFIFENVKNLLSHDKGRTFRTILRTLHDIGYDVQWSVLNSKDFGVPQNRERVYIVGHLRGERPPEIFSIRQENERPNEKRIKIIASTQSEDSTGSGYREEIYSSEGIAGALTASDYKDSKKIAKLIQIIPGRQGERVCSFKGIACTQNTLGGGLGAKTGLYAVPILTLDRANKRQNGRRLKNHNEPMFTLTTQDRRGVLLINGKEYQVRRLTPKECFRLQGFPDWAYEAAKKVGLSDAQLYKQAGNAATANVVRWIGERLKQLEE